MEVVLTDRETWLTRVKLHDAEHKSAAVHQAGNWAGMR